MTGFVPPPYPYERLDEVIGLAEQHDGGAVDLSIGTPCDSAPSDVIAAAQMHQRVWPSGRRARIST